MKTMYKIKSQIKLNILGIGFVCIDIIKERDTIRYYTGGSCGNVTSALSYLGCNSSVVTYNYKDLAGYILKQNLYNAGVNQYQIGEIQANAPRVIEELYCGFGNCNNHKFIFKCNKCGRDLPHLKPLSISDAEYIEFNINDNFNVFYTDRTSAGIKYLRDLYNKRGKWTFYEPNSVRNKSSFFSNSLSSHIVKFSCERIPFDFANEIRDKSKNQNITLLIYTKGKDGLLYCYRMKNEEFSKWHHLDAQPIPRFVDSSGAGDWCTAGIITALLGNNEKTKNWFSKSEVVSALQYGQALAAISCCFIGGQGLMFANTLDCSEDLLQIIDFRPIKQVPIPAENDTRFCHTCLLDL